MPNNVVSLRGIEKSFGENRIINGVDLDVQEGEVVVILGPSGSGKTTLLRTINFLDPADQGEITIDGQTVNAGKHNHKEVRELRRKTGMVFQNYNLFQNRTALENITLGLRKVQKVPKAEAEQKAYELLDYVKMKEKADSYPAKLSGGQQQRIGICRALAGNPKVVLLDEPTSALDPELVSDVLDVIKQIAATGITMIIVTHEIAFAREVADRVIFMKGGVIVEQGPAKEVIDHPQNPETNKFLNALIPERSMEYVI